MLHKDTIIIRAKKKRNMKNPKNKSWFKFLSNKYVWVLLFYYLDGFLDNYSYFDHRFLDNQTGLEDNATYYKEEIKKG
jgi:hypothetical protein